MKKWVVSALLILVVGLAGVAYTFDWNHISEFGTKPFFEEKTVEAAAVSNIIAKSSGVSMDIKRGTSEDIVVRLAGRASSKYLDRFKLTTEQDGDTVILKGSQSNKFVIGINIVDVKMTIELPQRLWDKVEVTNDSGSIHVADLEGKTVSVTTQSGNIKAEAITSDDMDFGVNSGSITLSDLNAKSVNLEAKSGNIQVERYTSDILSYKINSGNVKLYEGTGELRGEGSSGYVKIQTSQITQPIELKTASGNVTILTEQEPASAQILLTSSSGNSKVAWQGFKPLVDSNNEHDKIGSIGAGDDIVIKVHVNSGNIKLGNK